MKTIATLNTTELASEGISNLPAQIHELYKAMVNNPLQKKPDISEIASGMNISKATFQYVFKLLYGDSPYQVYLNIKFAYAKQILRSGHHKIGEVARLLGYSQSAKFVQIFKKRENQTPLQYAKSYKAGKTQMKKNEVIFEKKSNKGINFSH